MAGFVVTERGILITNDGSKESYLSRIVTFRSYFFIAADPFSQPTFRYQGQQYNRLSTGLPTDGLL